AEMTVPRVRIVNLLTHQIYATPFISATSGTPLGMVFDPDYDTNGWLYLFTQSGGDCWVRRYQRSAGNADVADPALTRPIIHISRLFGEHTGSWMGFGPDGSLYIATGDGGQSGAVQSLANLQGKMLRIDPHADDYPADEYRNYAVPADNPYVGVPGAMPEI